MPASISFGRMRVNQCPSLSSLGSRFFWSPSKITRMRRVQIVVAVAKLVDRGLYHDGIEHELLRGEVFGQECP